MNYPVKEVLAKVTIGTEEVYVFPSYTGGTILSAESVCQGAIRGRNAPFIIVHMDKADRRKTARKLNARQITFMDKEVVDVPADIVALYQPVVDETEEDAKKRYHQIKAYFETV